MVLDLMPALLRDNILTSNRRRRFKPPSSLFLPFFLCSKIPHSAAAGKAFALTDKQLDAAVDFLDPNQDGNVSNSPCVGWCILWGREYGLLT